MKVAVIDGQYMGQKMYKINEDLSSWAVKFLNGRRPLVEIAGSKKIPDEEEEQKSVQSLDRLRKRKGIK